MTRRHRDHDPDLRAVYTRRRFLVGSAAAAVPLSIWWVLRSGDDAPTDDGTAAPPPPTSPTEPPGANDPAPSSTTSTPPEPVEPLTHDLHLGMTDRKVGLLQRRLTELAFDPGPIDDYFGQATVRSVWAFDKLVLGTPRTEATGVVTPAMWDRLFGAVSIAPRRRPGGTHLEVYLPEQVAVLFDRGRPWVVSHVSSGEGIEWCDVVTVDQDDGTTTEQGICGRSVTPGGVYHFERKVEGWRNAKLGRLYKPVYFNYGIAIHGATIVPNYPASRGCVRFPMHIAEYLQDLVEIGDDVYVFDGVEEPEVYGAQPMIFDWPDPNYTTTTSTSTSTTTTSTTSTTTPPNNPPPTTTTSTTPPRTTTTTAPTTTVPPTTSSPGG